MTEAVTKTGTILAFDIGGQRIGVARASTISRLPSPLITLINNEQIFDDIKALLKSEEPIAIVVGLPRGLNGQETEQTAKTRVFGAALEKQLRVPIYYQDEALTSVKAEEELRSNGKPYNKGMVDALAATYILEDFLNQHGEIR